MNAGDGSSHTRAPQSTPTDGLRATDRSALHEVESSGPRLVGRSRVFRHLVDRLMRVAPFDRPVLLHGPTGAGKELAATAVHAWSGRGADAFVVVNCAGAEEPLTHELFGHERGGPSRRAGLLAEVGAGTVFLDDVAELSPLLQLRLLQLLESGSFRPQGGAPRAFHGRVVASTRENLLARVEARAFRPDLYYRLTAFQVRVPALTERREDIPLLAQHFLDVRLGAARFEPEALRALGDYLWPGNVRQLKSVVERVALLGDGRIDEALVNAELLSEGHGTRPLRASPRARLRALAREILALPIDDKLDAIRRCLEEEALELADGDAAEAAQRLGITEAELARSAALHASTSPPSIDDDPQREVV